MWLVAALVLFPRQAERMFSTPEFHFGFDHLETRLAKAVLAIVWVGLLVYMLFLGPISLRRSSPSGSHKSLPLRGVPAVLSYRVTLAQYMMLGIPLMVLVMKGIKDDRLELNLITDRIDKIQANDEYQRAERLVTEGDQAIDALRRVVDRYLWFVFILAFVYVIELFGGVIRTLACPAQIITRLSAWAFVLVVIPYLIRRGLFRHSAIRDRLCKELDRCLQNASGETISKVRELRRDVVSRFSPLGMLKDLRQTTVAFGLGVTMLTAVTGTVIKLGLDRKDLNAMKIVNLVAPPVVDRVFIEIVSLLDLPNLRGGYEPQLCFTERAPAGAVSEFRQRKQLSRTNER
jgi:hypothetical protein